VATYRQCKAKRKDGQRCTRRCIKGGFVCIMHGGSAPHVRAAANERLADLIDPDRALREAARLAYSDVRGLFDENQKLKPMKDWPEGLAAAVASVEVVRRNVDSGDDHTDDVIKLKLWDKPKNLEMLFKHLGLLTEKLEHSGSIEIKWQS